ncbi:MAG: transcription initiation protein [Phycisphaerae bacterium]|nr:transcription initiation protein [Gemmatimonadaceae bacterium]
MSEFILLYRSSDAANREAMGSPEKAQQSMQKWLTWMRELEGKGNLKDFGQPLENGGMMVRGTAKTVVDGPYAETKDLIGGYSILIAETIAQAAELAKGCPVLDGGGSVEVRPVMKMGV